MLFKVSIIIPVYNSEIYLEKCLDTVINQSYTNIEIIIVNDGSSDGSEKIINKYKELDSRIISINQINQGAGAARNKGLSLCNGDYICFVDSDDYIEKSYVEDLVETIKDGDLFSFCNFCKGEKKIEVSKTEELLLIYPGIIGKLYSAKEIKGAEFSNHHIAEDLIFNYKLLLKNDSISKVEKYLYYYVINPSSISNNSWKYGNEIFDAIEELYNLSKEKNINDEKMRILEFCAIRYILFGNFKRIKNHCLSKEYILKSLEFVEIKFPKWYENIYIKDYVWDKDMIVYFKNRDIDNVYKYIIEKY